MNSKRPQSAVFLFHRDLRLRDNSALIKLALAHEYQIIPVFILDPAQIDRKKNEFFSNPAVQFMCESLADLDDQLKALGSHLHILRGETSKAISQLHKEIGFSAIAWNEDISAFAKERDSTISKWAEHNRVNVITSRSDFYLTDTNEGLGPSGEPYKVLAAFWKWFLKNKTVPQVNIHAFKAGDFSSEHVKNTVAIDDLKAYYTSIPLLALHGGRKLGLQRLNHIASLKDYAEERDFPAKTESTSRLSPYLKFGCVSVREVYHKARSELGRDHPFVRELVFRDFYAKIYSQSAELQRGKTAVTSALDDKLNWLSPSSTSASRLWKSWMDGTTGFPLVDAGMRELNATGHQHNRVRMLCASVLTKYMWIDWRAGLKYYYTHLVDADIFSNTAGWGFVSSTGIDAVPYFRAPFNPFTQSKKFDPEAEYIKRWVPELKDVPAKDIHKWDVSYKKYEGLQYPPPILDYKKASGAAVKKYREAANTT